MADQGSDAWTKTLLTFGGNIIETGTESYWLSQTRAQADAAANKTAV